jgi:hypothetical protein
MPIFGEINGRITMDLGKVCDIVTMSALIRKSSGLKVATSAELDRLRALRRIVIYQGDLDVIDQSISRLEHRDSAAIPPARLVSAPVAATGSDASM